LPQKNGERTRQTPAGGFRVPAHQAQRGDVGRAQAKTLGGGGAQLGLGVGRAVRQRETKVGETEPGDLWGMRVSVVLVQWAGGPLTAANGSYSQRV